MKRLLSILLVCISVTTCGTAARQGQETSDNTKPTVSSKRVSIGERYVLTDGDRTGYLSMEDFYEKRCSKPRGSISVNSDPGDPLVKVDGCDSSLDAVSIFDVYSIRVVPESQTASYGFRGIGGVIEIETIGHHESMLRKSGSLFGNKK